MSNVLQFSLGLSAGNFLSNMAKATTAVGALLGGTLTVGAGLSQVFQQINNGGRLFDLTKRTGENVASLFKLEQGLEDVGIAAGNLPALIGQVQKALGGVNDQGEPTAEVFSQLGLSIQELKGLDAAGQIQTISKALAGLDKETAFNFASKIAGRGGAGDLVQIARSADDFAEAMARSSRQAEQVARSAEAFDRIGDTMRNLKVQSQSVFVGIAEGITPGLQAVLDSLQTIDFVKIGDQIGNTFKGIGQIIREERFDELIGATFQAGFEQAAAYGDVFVRGFYRSLTSPEVNQMVGSVAARSMVGAAQGLGEALRVGANVAADPKLGALVPGLETLSPFAKKFSIFTDQRQKDLFGVIDQLDKQFVESVPSVLKQFTEAAKDLVNVQATPGMRRLSEMLNTAAERADAMGRALGGNRDHKLLGIGRTEDPDWMKAAGAAVAAVRPGTINDLTKTGLVNFGSRKTGDEALKYAKDQVDILRQVKTLIEKGQTPILYGNERSFLNLA